MYSQSNRKPWHRYYLDHRFKFACLALLASIALNGYWLSRNCASAAVHVDISTQMADDMIARTLADLRTVTNRLNTYQAYVGKQVDDAYLNYAMTSPSPESLEQEKAQGQQQQQPQRYTDPVSPPAQPSPTVPVPVQTPRADNVVATKSGGRDIQPPPMPSEELTQAQMIRIQDAYNWEINLAENKESIAQLVKAMPDGGTILDVGANVGAITSLAAKACPKCHVLGFEPVPAYFKFAATVACGGLPNVELFNWAVCDHVGPQKIFVDPGGNLGWNTIVAAKKDNGMLEKEVQCITLDALMDSPRFAERLKNVKVIKVDVEGAEHYVIRGMKKLITSLHDRLPLLLLEVGWGKSRPDWQQEVDAFEWLFAQGYKRINLDAIQSTGNVVLEPLPRNGV